MKNTKNKTKKPTAKVIKELASKLEEDLKNTLPLAIQPDGSVVYEHFVIKQDKFDNWCVYNTSNKTLIETYYLKTCAIMAAKAYSKTNLTKYFEIKELDNKYWASHSNNLMYKNSIKKTKDFGRYIILLNRLEYEQEKEAQYKDRISTMFKWSFV
jgi:hypothetical protein